MSVGFSVGFPALLLSLVVIAVTAEIDGASVDTSESLRHMGANSEDSSFEQFGYCNSLEKGEAFECFRDMAVTVREKTKENAILVGANMALVDENTAMASAIAKLQSSVETGDLERYSHLEPMHMFEEPSDGTHLQNPPPFPRCNAFYIHVALLHNLLP